MDKSDLNYFYKAEPARVIDGDTFDFHIDVGFKSFIHKRIRLLSVDTYELRGGTDATKLLGQEAKEYVHELFAVCYDNIYVKTQMDATGKYGRVLGEVWLQIPGDTHLTNLADQLTRMGFVESTT